MTRFSKDPKRRTKPVSVDSDGALDPYSGGVPGNFVNLDEMIEDVERTMDKWGKVRDSLDKKYDNWSVDASSTSLSPLIRAVDPDSSGSITYRLFKRMVKRSLASWGVDPVEVETSKSGDIIKDHETFSTLLRQAIIRVDRNG